MRTDSPATELAYHTNPDSSNNWQTTGFISSSFCKVFSFGIRVLFVGMEVSLYLKNKSAKSPPT